MTKFCASELGGVLADFARRDFDQTLDDESRLGAASAAIGVDRRGGRVDRVDFDVDRGNVVLARKQRRIEERRHQRRKRRQIGAEVGDRVHAHAGDLAAGVCGQFGVSDVVAAVRVGEERLRPVSGPLHGAVELLGRPGADRLFGVNEYLRAEAAADVGRDDAELVLGREADESREHEPRDVRILARRVERQDVRARSRIRRAPRAAPSHWGSGGC